MHSPLPDSSALERGILTDTPPTRLSRVQDNVRNLLRNSHFGSIRSSPPTTPTHQPIPCHRQDIPPTPPETPTHHRSQHTHEPEVLPSPTESLRSTASPASTTSSASLASPTQTHEEASGGLFPPPKYASPFTRLSVLFTSRPAPGTVNHPDVSGASVEALVRQKAAKRQRRAWKRKRSGGSSAARGGGGGGGSSQCLLCAIAALMLASIVATYLIVATTSSSITTTFHVLFILGIILATIVFAHTLIRLLLFSGRFRRGQPVLILPTSHKHKHRRRHHHHARREDSLAVQTVRVMPGLSADEPTEYIPATPIRVRMGSGNPAVRPVSGDVEPAIDPTQNPEEAWNKSPSPIANPPPAYGRWRGSVRANPDLLHWQAIPSPVDPDVQELPSPTYEEAVLAQRTGPPSYVTRESPARTAGREDVRGSVLARAEEQERVVEPEMVEVVGDGEEAGVGMAK